MAARITSIAVNCSDPAALAAFWSQVLGWEVHEADDELVTLGPPGRPEARPVMDLIRVPDPTPGRRRLHLDLNATDRDQDAELVRLLELGATRVDVGQGDVEWVVLADPEGNEFCLLRSRVSAG
ncbi:Glyoxalase-like domain-containing protein [Klenkia soli]|uniref:Glyoxalase-like domain-containing protein n=1 Tax=Klenkia soli TaxID=1052260 RepID=A0A1H0HXQ1_9ACTN|nr:VOC family protein [Klenkia soli]SDO23601.1 Glyoxalase-like domain-containing protein [Klenkia soli]